MGSRITGERERETLVKFLSFIYFSLRPVSGWGLQADRQRAGPSGRDAVLPRGMRRRMQRQSEQPVRRLQARHPQQGMPIRLSSWPIPGKYLLSPFPRKKTFSSLGLVLRDEKRSQIRVGVSLGHVHWRSAVVRLRRFSYPMTCGGDLIRFHAIHPKSHVDEPLFPVSATWSPSLIHLRFIYWNSSGTGAASPTSSASGCRLRAKRSAESTGKFPPSSTWMNASW